MVNIMKFYDGVKMAEVAAELTRQGIAFSVEQNGDEFTLSITGF